MGAQVTGSASAEQRIALDQQNGDVRHVSNPRGVDCGGAPDRADESYVRRRDAERPLFLQRTALLSPGAACVVPIVQFGSDCVSHIASIAWPIGPSTSAMTLW
jgi:hypothetical protein